MNQPLSVKTLAQYLSYFVTASKILLFHLILTKFFRFSCSLLFPVRSVLLTLFQCSGKVVPTFSCVLAFLLDFMFELLMLLSVKKFQISG